MKLVEIKIPALQAEIIMWEMFYRAFSSGTSWIQTNMKGTAGHYTMAFSDTYSF
jgi:hypothetical protein